MLLLEAYRNSLMMNWRRILDSEDLYSIMSFHFIITSHNQRTRFIIISTFQWATIQNYGLQWWKIYYNHFILFHSILSIIVDKDLQNAQLPNVMDCRFGRSNHYNIQYQFNTSNHKGTPPEIIWSISNCTNLNGL